MGLIRGVFTVAHYRNGQLLEEFEVQNNATIEGRNLMLDVMFNSEAPIAAWYIGLVDGAVTPVFDENDTLASNGWDELTSYTQATRIAWSPAAASGASIENTTRREFTINATCTVAGLFLASDNTKGGTAGVLFAGAAFDTPRNFVNGDVCQIQYTVALELP